VCNSQLLHTYCEIDERVAPLGMSVKLWAKNRKISDAAQGTISSYAWSIMLLSFLQSCEVWQ
jgi:terminal uridylyltransferase